MERRAQEGPKVNEMRLVKDSKGKTVKLSIDKLVPHKLDVGGDMICSGPTLR